MKKTLLNLMLLSNVYWGNAIAGEMNSPNPIKESVKTFMGFYAGINGGYAFANTKTLRTNSQNIQYCTAAQGCSGGDMISSISATSASKAFSLNKTSFLGGGELGYNQKVYKEYILGLETDIQGFGSGKQRDSSSSNVSFVVGNAPQSISTNLKISKNIDFLGSLRGKLGYLVKPNIFIYGSGGLAYGNVSSKTSVQQNYGFPANINSVVNDWGSTGKYSNTRIGFSFGGAIDWMFRANLSAKFEYLYYNLGKVSYHSGNLADAFIVPNTPQNYFTNTMSTTTRFDGNILRLGLNYHFA